MVATKGFGHEPFYGAADQCSITWWIAESPPSMLTSTCISNQFSMEFGKVLSVRIVKPTDISSAYFNYEYYSLLTVRDVNSRFTCILVFSR
jgi:hypothetical protein